MEFLISCWHSTINICESRGPHITLHNSQEVAEEGRWRGHRPHLATSAASDWSESRNTGFWLVRPRASPSWCQMRRNLRHPERCKSFTVVIQQLQIRIKKLLLPSSSCCSVICQLANFLHAHCREVKECGIRFRFLLSIYWTNWDLTYNGAMQLATLV